MASEDEDSSSPNNDGDSDFDELPLASNREPTARERMLNLNQDARLVLYRRGHRELDLMRIEPVQANMGNVSFRRSERHEVHEGEGDMTHSYMGALDRIEARLQYYATGEEKEMPLCSHTHIIYPGETIPMIVSRFSFPTDFDIITNPVFALYFSNTDTTMRSYWGVTCQIYERRLDDYKFIIKSRALQRFILYDDADNNILHFRQNQSIRRCPIFGKIRILPEFEPMDVYYGLDINTSRRNRNNANNKMKVLRMQTITSSLPNFVFDQYDVDTLLQRIYPFIDQGYVDQIPSNLVRLTFWLARKTPIDTQDQLDIMHSDSCVQRLRIIAKSLTTEKHFFCQNCNIQISSNENMITISGDGYNSNYCNPNGHMHEMHTVSAIFPSIARAVGSYSTEFSWFPGYAWRIMNCRNCSMHIGWVFLAGVVELRPKKFFGLSGTTVKLRKRTKAEEAQLMRMTQ